MQENITMELKTQWGSTENVQLEINNYSNNNGLYIGLVCSDEDMESYGDLTVNLMNKAPAYCAYINTNNMPEAEKFITEKGLGEYTGLNQRSGYCEYPLYMFDVDRLREVCPEGMAMYEANIGVQREPQKKEMAR